MAAPQRYLTSVDGREYALSVADEGWSRRLVLQVDGEEVVSRKSSDERLTLKPEDEQVAEDVGKVELRLTTLGRVRRATLRRGDLELDLDPEPGSKAALREEKARRHPTLYAARHVVEGLGSVVWLIVGGVVVAFVLRVLGRFVPDVDLPSVPLPDVDLPDLPSVPWPDWSLPDLTLLPGWLDPVLAATKYVGPVVVGIALAVREVRRRRRQDELKQRLRQEQHAVGDADAEEGRPG